MCDPISMTVASVAISAASGAMQYEGERRAASRQADAIRENQAANDAALQTQAVQQDQQASQQMSERARQAMIDRGRMIAAFSSSGLGGASQGVAGNAIDFAASTDIATLEANRQSRAAQTQNERVSGYRQARQQMAAIKVPNPLAVGLQVAGSGLNAYSNYKAGQKAGG